MRVIRKGIFETNSSTTHSCVIMTEKQYKDWEETDLYHFNAGWYNPWKERNLPVGLCPKDNKLYTQEEVLMFLKQIGYDYSPEDYEDYEDCDNLIDCFIKDSDYFIRYSDWENMELESDINYFTTDSGEIIVVICKYGADY